MARGNFWEATFDPAWDGPTALGSLSDAQNEYLRLRIQGQQTSVRWRIRDGVKRTFVECDFESLLDNSLWAHCSFVRCRFRGSYWTDVKFSNCSFEQCDFSGAEFIRCHFLADCRFFANTASAELFRISESSVSSHAFINGLQTNLNHLPKNVSIEYQQHRFVITKAKIARALFVATKNEPDLDFYFEAQEQLIRCSLDEAVEKHRYGGGAQDQPKRLSALRSVPARVARSVILSSGWLTSWGKNLYKAGVFLILIIGLFAVAYKTTQPGLTLFDSLQRSANVSLVVGYTAFYNSSVPPFQRMLMFFNVVTGMYWYALVIPVITRRTLR